MALVLSEVLALIVSVVLVWALGVLAGIYWFDQRNKRKQKYLADPLWGNPSSGREGISTDAEGSSDDAVVNMVDLCAVSAAGETFHLRDCVTDTPQIVSARTNVSSTTASTNPNPNSASTSTCGLGSS